MGKGKYVLIKDKNIVAIGDSEEEVLTSIEDPSNAVLMRIGDISRFQDKCLLFIVRA